MKWTKCEWDDETTRPKLAGIYAVVIEGDSERDGPHVFYEFGDYQTFAVVAIEDGEVVVRCDHDEESGSIIAWLGPIDIPPWRNT